MNKAIIESIEWHRNQLFKLLGDEDFVKMEGGISSVKTELNEIIEKAKAKKKVWVKPTAQKKGHYREMDVGRAKEIKRKEIVTTGSAVSALITQEKKLIDEAKKLRKEKIDPMLKKLADLQDTAGAYGEGFNDVILY